MPMQFTDLKTQYSALKADIDVRIQHGFQYLICVIPFE